MKRYLLLDIDGVLVRPLGYRAALRDSVATFAAWMGLADFQVEEEVISDLEARGISSEFDMLPLLVGALLEAFLSSTAIENVPQEVEEAAQSIATAHPSPPQKLVVPTFPLQEGCFPSEAAYRNGVYPSLPDALRRNLLLNTRHVYRSATTRLFQQFVLGSQRFSEIYGLPAQVQAPSYLMEYDQPLLDALSCARLEQAWQRGDCYVVAMTARPSLPPCGVAPVSEPYPPEAEAALELIGLPDLPLIGLGKLEYVARQASLPVENLLKPSPAQALAALLVAGGKDELAAIESALARLAQRSPHFSFDSLPKQFELHVVEDTLGGIRSVRTAAQFLEEIGHRVSVCTWGLTDGNPQKRKSLEGEGVRCFDTWEELLDRLGF